MNKFYGDEGIGWWESDSSDELIYPSYLKANQEEFEWKRCFLSKRLWPWLYGSPLHYQEY